MRIVLTLFTAVLVLEYILHAIALLAGMEAGIQPLSDHFGFRPARVLVLLIAVLDLAAAAGLTAGLWHPGVRLAAALYGTLYFGMMMGLRFRRRLGTLIRPPDFPLFLTLSALILIMTAAN